MLKEKGEGVTEAICPSPMVWKDGRPELEYRKRGREGQRRCRLSTRHHSLPTGRC